MTKSLFAADSDFLSREQAKALSDQVLALAKADETRVAIASSWAGNTRFAGNQITTNGGTTDTIVTITSTIGKRRASAQTNVLDAESLKRTVAFAESLAKLSPEDPEIMPELGPQQYATVNSYFDTTANLGPETRAAAVGRAITAAEQGGKAAGDVFVAGFLQANAGAQAIATSRGLFAYHRSTTSDLGVTVRTPDATGSGWARGGSRDWTTVDAASVGRVAAQKAVASHAPKAVEPGLYTVILEPAAVGQLIPQFIGAFNARANDEGRGTFSKPGGGTKLGEKIADERVTIFSDPTDPDLLASPFAADGTPMSRSGLRRERHSQELLVRPVLGAEAGKESDRRRWRPRRWWRRRWRRRWWRRHQVRRRHEVGRGIDRGLHPRDSRDPLLLHQLARSSHGAAHWPHARRNLPHRERKDHAGREELSLERKSVVHAEQDRRNRSRAAHGRGAGDALAPGEGLQLRLAVRRRIDTALAFTPDDHAPVESFDGGVVHLGIRIP